MNYKKNKKIATKESLLSSWDKEVILEPKEPLTIDYLIRIIRGDETDDRN